MCSGDPIFPIPLSCRKEEGVTFLPQWSPSYRSIQIKRYLLFLGLSEKLLKRKMLWSLQCPRGLIQTLCKQRELLSLLQKVKSQPLK